MGHGAWGIGHGALGMGHWAWGIGHGALVISCPAPPASPAPSLPHSLISPYSPSIENSGVGCIETCI